MTFNVLKDITQKITCLSNALPGDDPLTKNLCVDSATMPETIKYLQETFAYDDTFYATSFTIPDYDGYQDESSMSIIENSDLVREIFPHKHT